MRIPRRRRGRHTLSGVSDSIMQEIERHSRLSKRGSMIGNKIRSLVRSSSGNRLVEKIHKPRPKSLDLDAIDFEVPAGPL
uniref:Uncharacterized protein n=1 Tax=Magallana gigas TaxID=29159 RepID=A0A8W8J5U0_MAGGI